MIAVNLPALSLPLPLGPFALLASLWDANQKRANTPRKIALIQL